MVMASWPQPSDRRGHRPASSRVRRRVDAALTRATRQALRVGGPLLAVIVATDVVEGILRSGTVARPGTYLGVMEMIVAVVATLVLRRAARPEPVAFAMLFAVLAGTVLEPGMSTNRAMVSVGYVVMLFLASGLFLPWSPRWHSGWLAAGLALTVIGAGAGTFGASDADLSVVVVAGMAAAASGVGQLLNSSRLRRGLEQRFELRDLTRVSVRQEQSVRDLNEELVRTARVDVVTGLGNRRALDEALAAFAGQRLAAVLLDLDHFKAFNDRFGHLAGDVALARIGDVLRSSTRGGDLAFRYGGEEFLVLVPGGDVEGARGLAERIRTAVSEDLETGGEGLTISAGVAAADRFSSSDPLPLLRRADAALYRAKREGRNRVMVSGKSTSEVHSLAG